MSAMYSIRTTKICLTIVSKYSANGIMKRWRNRPTLAVARSSSTHQFVIPSFTTMTFLLIIKMSRFKLAISAATLCCWMMFFTRDCGHS
jgi:hypothetical protein